MAKIQIKSERLTLLGGIFSVMEQLNFCLSLPTHIFAIRYVTDGFYLYFCNIYDWLHVGQDIKKETKIHRVACNNEISEPPYECHYKPHQ